MGLRPISDIFLSDKPATLASSGVSEPQSIKTTPSIVRVPGTELELTYLHNPTVFNSVNKIVQTIMDTDRELVCKDKKALKFFRDDFLPNIGHSSGLTWDDILYSVFQHQCIYGKAWVENIFNKRGNRIVDYDMIDPKKMDYAKNSNNKIVLDEFSNAVGYMETIPIDESVDVAYQSEQSYPDPRISAPAGSQNIFLSPDEVALIKYNTFGDGFYPLGLVEPIYTTSLRKMNIEKALANSIWRHGFPTVWAQLGDLSHEPSPQQITNMLDKLKGLKNNTEVCTPYFYQLHLLETKQTIQIIEHLNYFRQQEISGLGIPSMIATGDVSKGTGAALSKQESIFHLTVHDLIKKTSSQIRTLMFKPVCDLEGFKDVPALKWECLGTDELDRKSRRLLKYAQAGLLVPDMKMQDFIKKVEDLDE